MGGSGLLAARGFFARRAIVNGGFTWGMERFGERKGELEAARPAAQCAAVK
jgi:hypothetical protein